MARRAVATSAVRRETRAACNRGVEPAIQVHYRASKVKQYFKEGRALRTETTVNDTRDFGIGKRLHNLPALADIGFQANRRLLEVEKLSHDCILAEEAFQNACLRALRTWPQKGPPRDPVAWLIFVNINPSRQQTSIPAMCC